jgi:hypothetical protein
MKLRLNSGREIQLRSLRQRHVNEGFLEGFPTREWKHRIVDGIVTEASSAGTKPLLIEPVEKPIDLGGYRWPLGDPVRLPSVACVARFSSPSPMRKREAFESGLAVVWFQEEFRLPVDIAVMEQLRAMDWETLAQDVEYQGSSP